MNTVNEDIIRTIELLEHKKDNIINLVLKLTQKTNQEYTDIIYKYMYENKYPYIQFCMIIAEFNHLYYKYNNTILNCICLEILEQAGFDDLVKLLETVKRK